MRRHLVLSIALVASSPALAADGGLYIGVEGGAAFSRHIGYDVTATRVQTVPTGNGLLGQTVTTTNTRYGDGFVADQKTGVDADVIAGFRFGLFRVEGELGYKRSKLRGVTPSTALLNDINTAPISGVTADSFALGGRTRVLSAMANGLLDYDVAPRLQIYGGVGAGRAQVKSLGDKDNAWAYQLIGGASTPVGANLRLGLKYRYFQTDRLHFANGASFSNAATGATSVSQFAERGRFRSHSLLASLVYSFGSGS